MAQIKQRFGGTQRLYGIEQTKIIADSHVCIVGIGGVGCWVAEGLARSAVGQLTLIDLDDICVTNTNRQIHAMHSTIGLAKVEQMKKRILDINPDCEVDAIEDFVTAENVAEILNRGFDYVVDATDSIKAKASMIVYCKRNKIPILTMGGAGGQIDPTQITISDLSKTIQDPLAAKLRSELRRWHNFSVNSKRRFGVECVYSTEQLRYPQQDGTVCATKNLPGGSVKLDCNTGFGASVAVTATFGFVAVARVIDKLIAKAQTNKAGDITR